MKSTSAAAALMGVALQAHSQDSVNGPAPDVAPVVVTATRIATPVTEVGSSISLITAADIEARQWRTLPAALAESPGLNVVQAGGPGGQTSVFIRGANANHTKVIIDGIEVNDPSQNGAFDFGQALTDDVERIEILRGPQSSLYGADALGGVISITTRRGEDGARATARLEGGSFDTFNQALAFSGKSSNVRYAFNLSHFRSGDTPVTPLGLLAPGEARIGDRYDNLTASSRLDAQVTRVLGLGFIARAREAHYRFTSENYNVFPAIPDAAQSTQQTRQLFLRGEARLSLPDGRLETTTGLAYSRYRTVLLSPDDGFGAPAPVFDRGDRVKADWQGALTLSPRYTVVAGADYTEDRLIDSPVSASESRAGGFAEITGRPATGFAVAVSVRYDSDDRFGDRTTWRIAPTYTLPASGTRFKASVGTGFKTPTLTQLFVSFPPFFFSNPDLKPETSLGYDICFEQPVAHGRARVGATWFHNAIRDLIETNQSGDSWDNIGRATSYGVESFASLAITRRLDVRADYTWTIARDDVARQELLRRPKNKATLSVQWRATDKLILSGSALYVGARIDGNRDFSIPRLTASPYATFDVAGSYELGRGVTAFARIDNLLDRHYQDPVGFDRPGLGAYAGVKVDLSAR